MREEFIWFMFERNRTRLLKLAESCPADKRTVIPAGFRNHVLWHLGHILTLTDSMVYGISGKSPKLPETYKGFFGNGTKPEDWTGAEPSWETVVEKLEEQLGQIRGDFAGKLSEPVNESFTKAETADELLMFTMNHETNHFGNVNAMIKILLG